MSHPKYDAIERLTWKMVYANEALIKADLIDLFRKINALRNKFWETIKGTYDGRGNKITNGQQ